MLQHSTSSEVSEARLPTSKQPRNIPAHHAYRLGSADETILPKIQGVSGSGAAAMAPRLQGRARKFPT
eukprot:gene12275-biopygen16924